MVSNKIYVYDWQRHYRDLVNPAGAAPNIDNALSTLNNDQVVAKMRQMFESSLQLHANGQYMEACQAITAHLYPHQMYALAWMSKRENTKGVGVRGGILAGEILTLYCFAI